MNLFEFIDMEEEKEDNEIITTEKKKKTIQIDKKISFLSKKEYFKKYYHQNREYFKNYYHQHKEKILESQKRSKERRKLKRLKEMQENVL